MRRIISLSFWAAVVGAVLLFSTSAWAHTTGKAPDFQAHGELEEVVDDLEEMWLEENHLFLELKELRDNYVELSSRSGTRPVPAARMLQGLGDDALLPMLWHLVNEDPMELGMDLRTWRNWRVGLVEAVGRIGDDRSIGVLHSIVVADNPHEQMRTVATVAIGRTGNASAIEDVIDVARQATDKRASIVDGLGKARRDIAARYLLEIAQSSDDGEHHLRAVRALGDWANQWAWETPALEAYRGERDEVVDEIVELLVGAYPHVASQLQTEIEKTLQLSGAQLSKDVALQRASGTSDKSENAKLERLARVMANSPLD